MVDSWSSLILGHKAQPETPNLLSLCYMTISELVGLLCEELELPRGLLLVEPRWGGKPQLVRQQAGARKIDLQELINDAAIFPYDSLVNSDLTFVVHEGRAFPRTDDRKRILDWATAKGHSWIRQMDNQYAWFSSFSKSQERKIFLRFITQTIARLCPKEMKLNWSDWLRIRTGIYSHGWTLSRCDCSFGDGELRLNLWGGTPVGGLIRSVAKLSTTRKRLMICFDSSGRSKISIRKQACPLDDATGI